MPGQQARPWQAQRQRQRDSNSDSAYEHGA
jgi:hypothetical protein